MKKASIVLLGLFLQGCGGSAIDTVKNTYVDLAKTTTYSQMLDNRSICASVNWAEGKDSNQRTTVEYTCIFKDSDDFLAKYREIEVSSRTRLIDSEIENLKKDHEIHKQWAERSYAEREQDVADLTAEVENANRLNIPGDDAERRLQTAKDILAKAKNDVEYSKQKVAEFPEKLKELEHRRDEIFSGKSQFEKFPVLNKVREKLQWTVNKEGGVALMQAGFYVDDAARGEISPPGMSNTKRHLETLFKSRASDWKSYVINEQWRGGVRAWGQ